MTCLRCEGFMVEDHCLDMGGAYGEMWTTSWRCMNCGCVHDAVIEHHQLARQEKVLAVPSGVPEFQDDEVYLGAETFMRRAA
jgi:hypothetical protein